MSKRIWIFSLVVAGLLLLVGTASSPLFPYNVWDDANCYFTVGKSIMNGKVLYRDIFEQKGLYMYVIYGIGSLISKQSFLGLYFLEVIAMTIFFIFSARIMCHYVQEKFVYIALPIMGAFIITSPLFEKGGSAEELCLPFLMIILCHMVEEVGQKGKGLTKLNMLLDGALVGVIFWVKYSLIFPIAFAIGALLLFMLIKKEWKKFGQYIGLLAVGYILASLPVFLYFALNGALADLWNGYFYCNLFLYHATLPFNERVTYIVNWFSRYAKQNAVFVILITLSMVGFIRRHKETMGIKRFFLPVAFVGFLFGSMIIPGSVYQYYPLPSVIFLAFGMTEIGELIEKRTVMHANFITVPVLCIVCIAFTWFGANGYYLHELSKEELAPVQFAKIINQKPNATVLNYGCLDTGIYTLTGIEPPCKFFCRLNLAAYDEMNQVQQEIVDNKKVDFLVTLTSSPEPDNIDGYKQVAHVDQYLTDSTQYHLYQKIEK